MPRAVEMEIRERRRKKIKSSDMASLQVIPAYELPITNLVDQTSQAPSAGCTFRVLFFAASAFPARVQIPAAYPWYRSTSGGRRTTARNYRPVRSLRWDRHLHNSHRKCSGSY